MKYFRVCSTNILAMLLLPVVSFATVAEEQGVVADPSAAQIIEALKPKKPRTRNLVIQKPVAPVAVEPGAVSSVAPAVQAQTPPPSTTPAPAAPVVAQPQPAPPVVAAPAQPQAPAPTVAPAAQTASPSAAVSIKPEPPAAQVSEAAEESTSIDIAIQFELGSSRVSASSKKSLIALAAALADPQLAAMKFRIEGHTDSTGNADINKKISQSRANEVKRILVSRGVSAGRLFAEGKGSSEPLIPDNPGAAANRRVRITTID